MFEYQFLKELSMAYWNIVSEEYIQFFLNYFK